MPVILVLAGVLLVCGIGTATVLLTRTDAHGTRPSEDCAHVDQALRHWGVVLPGIQVALTGQADTTTLSRDTANAAGTVRREAESIEDPDLKATVTTLAGQLDLVSQGNSSSPPNGVPDKDYVGGLNGMMSTAHDLKVACPEAGD
jgi:hypothetical protein